MSQLLASDLNNTEFSGAQNPDAALIARFHTVPIKNEWRTNEEHRPIFEDVVFCEISIPGNPHLTVDQPVREDHKARFPIQWAHFHNKHGGDAREVGTPLTQWPLLTPSSVEELRALKFFTVESIANASDSALGRMGMVAGKAPALVREAAIRYLAVARDTSAVNHAAETAKAAEEKANALEAQNAEMKAQLEKLQEQMVALTTKKKPGRKPKPTESAE